MRGLGTHHLVDLYGVSPALLRDADYLAESLGATLDLAGFHVVERVVHRFTTGGEGVTGVFVLAESHLAFHTYPEHGYLALDLFSCGSADPRSVLSAIERSVAAAAVETVSHRRGGRIDRETPVNESASITEAALSS